MDGYVGKPLPRLEDQRFLTGKGCYTADIDLPDQVYAVVLRSPHAHAEIEGIEVEAALANDAPLLWPELSSNRSCRWQAGDEVAVAEGLRGAAHVIELEVEYPRQIVAFMEPRGDRQLRSGQRSVHAPGRRPGGAPAQGHGGESARRRRGLRSG